MKMLNSVFVGNTFQAIPPNGQLSLTYPFTPNDDLGLIPLRNNSKIYQITVFWMTQHGGAGGQVGGPLFWKFRLRLLNRDGSPNWVMAGNQINPVSGAFDGSLPKAQDLDLTFSAVAPTVLFKDGIEAGGVFLSSFSVQSIPGYSSNFDDLFFVTIFYEPIN